jgi:hypothetical protein
VIAASSDDDPPSRRKVIRAIRDKQRESVPPSSDRSPTAAAARREVVREMAAKNYTSRQIAKAVGVTREGLGNIVRELGIEIPADRVVGKTRVLDPVRVIDETIGALEGIAMGLALIEDVSSLDMEKRLQWLDAIREPLAAINRFQKELRG